MHGGAPRPREGAPSQEGDEHRKRGKRVDFAEYVLYSDYLKAECIFVSSSPHQDGDQEAEVASFLVSLARASVDSVAYFSPQPTQGVG